MCLILIAYGVHTDLPLVIAANRDEFYDRPAEPAGFWPDEPRILAGRDLKQGGTWLGVTRDGRFAAVTNIRRAQPPTGDRPSRGRIPVDFLSGDLSAQDFLAQLRPAAHDYDGFNLILADADGLFVYSNGDDQVRALAPGLHAISNDLPSAVWPKTQRGLALLSDWLETASREPAPLLDLMMDEHRPPDTALPDTGIGLSLERVLAPMFIRSEKYGTRCTSALLFGRDIITFAERGYRDGVAETELAFSLPRPD